MEADEKRARLLAEELKNWVGAAVVQGAVFFVAPGAPIRSEFTMYSEADLQKAFDLKLLHKRQLRISGHTGDGTIDILAAN